MTPRIPIPKERIAEFCRKWNVRELALFGSVLREDFGPQSDVDVLVTLEAGVRRGLFDWGCMQEELQSILSRPVDLVSRRGVEVSRHELRRRAILDSAMVVHANG